MTTSRPPVIVLEGNAPGAERGISSDFALFDALRASASAQTWTCAETAVVLGVSRNVDAEVDVAECGRRGVALLRRASGGGTVVIGPGTLQYAFALPHRGRGEAASVDTPFLDPSSIDAVKRFCSIAVREALAASGCSEAVDDDASGDLRIGSRKIAGVALRRRRDASLLHGTLLLEANLDLVAAVLRHPSREPAWRGGRPHLDFLRNVGPIDTETFAQAVERSAARWT